MEAPAPGSAAAAEAAQPVAMAAPGILKEYTDWKTFTADVHRHAAAQGKQVRVARAVRWAVCSGQPQPWAASAAGVLVRPRAAGALVRPRAAGAPVRPRAAGALVRPRAAGALVRLRAARIEPVSTCRALPFLHTPGNPRTRAQVMTGPSQRGGKGRRVLCTDYQEKRLAYEAAVLAKRNEDPTGNVTYLKPHPFAKVAHKYGACPFAVLASRSQSSKPIRVSALAPAGKTTLGHSESCTSTASAKAGALMADTRVANMVSASGHKASAKQLQAAARGPGLVTSTGALYAAQSQLQKVRGPPRCAATH